MKTVAGFLGYLRRSTDKQEQSLDGQREACFRFAAKNGGVIRPEDFYIDDAISGSDMSRPGLRSLVEACRTRTDVSGVVVWDRSRLARADDPRAALMLEYEIESTGKRLFFVNTAAQTGGGIASHIVALVESESAGKYLVDLSRNVMRGLEQTVKAGFLDGRVPPFGYDTLYVDQNSKPLFIARYNHDRSKEIFEAVINQGIAAPGRHVRSLAPSERPPRSRTDKPTLVLGDKKRQNVVIQMYEWAVNERIGFKKIAQRLNEMQVKAPMGGRWSVGSVREILINPVYRGALRWNYRRRGKFQRLSKDGVVPVTDRGSFKLLRNAAEDIYIKESAVPALVSTEMWFAAQKNRCERQKREYRGKAANATYLVSGVAFCCHGHRMQGFTAESKGNRYFRYRCSERQLGGPKACSTPNVLRDEVDNYVLGWVQKNCVAPLLKSKEVWAEFDAIISAAGGGKDTNGIRERIRKIDATISKIVDTIDEANLALLNGKLTKLREERAGLQATLSASDIVSVSADDYRQRAKDFASRLQDVVEQGTPQERKELIRNFVERVEIDSENNRGRLICRAPIFVLREKLSIQNKRVKGFEPSTSTLARSRSTTELHPREENGKSSGFDLTVKRSSNRFLRSVRIFFRALFTPSDRHSELADCRSGVKVIADAVPRAPRGFKPGNPLWPAKHLCPKNFSTTMMTTPLPSLSACCRWPKTKTNPFPRFAKSPPRLSKSAKIKTSSREPTLKTTAKKARPSSLSKTPRDSRPSPRR